MNNIKYILITYTIILALGIASLLTGTYHYANIAGFISAMGFMVVFFKDRDHEEEFSESELAQAKKLRTYWYIVFGTGFFFSLTLGTFWIHQMDPVTVI